MTVGPIRKQLIVEASREAAFDIFTEPEDRWYSAHEDGRECDIGYVVAWEPPIRVVLAWQINANFEFIPSLVTEIEINFHSFSPRRTRSGMPMLSACFRSSKIRRSTVHLWFGEHSRMLANRSATGKQ